MPDARVQKGWLEAEVLDLQSHEVRELHVVPVIEVPIFSSLDDANAFVIKLEMEDNPVVSRIVDGEKRLYTHFGHTLSEGCHCRPKREANETPLFVHAHVC